jgi:hypothetical protein
MNNKRYIIGLSIIMILTLDACDKMFDLKRMYPTDLTPQQVFENFNYNSERVNNIYSYLPNGFSYIDGAMLASATDDAEHTIETSAIQEFNTGSWNAIDNPDEAWSHYYMGIRAANLFLETSDSINLDEYKLDPQQQVLYQSMLSQINRWRYEVRFLRAFFYFELVKRYGGVPLITNTLSLNDNFKEVKRNTLEECITFITNECDSAAHSLPIVYPDADLGRVTKGVCLALKSRTLLYAASDLFNNPSWAGGYSNPELISLSGDREGKWKAAADAAKAVIDLNTYRLDDNYVNLFGVNNFMSQEVILARRNSPTNSFEQANYPIGYDLGRSGTTPSQNLVDAYEMKDGSVFSWNNPVEAMSPYDNRDPRLGYTVLTNNTLFKGRPVQCWSGGLDGKGVPLATRTGYYLRKYVDENLDLLQGQVSVHSWIIFRLAEAYLNYAEALNEYDAGNPDIRKYVDLVRSRQSVNMPSLPDNLSQSEMRDRIRNERRVELAFEGHRFWDTRRWILATADLGTPLNGVQITKTGASSFNYKKITVENRIFSDKMYLYPIPQNEISIDHDLIQNPKW